MVVLTRLCTLRTKTTAPEPDPYGDPVVTVTEVYTVCELQQHAATELRDGRLVTVSDWGLYLPADAAVTATTEVVVDGDTYAFDGEPWPVRDPWTRQTSHIEARVRKVR